MVGSALVPPPDGLDVDQIVVLHNMEWSDFERLLETRGDHRVPRMAYCHGDLEVMSPSRSREILKSRVGSLVEVHCDVHGVVFDRAGSRLVKEAETESGVEPDECFIFGDFNQERPDLAIEVIWNAVGLNKLDIFRRLCVPEVWYWRRGRFSAYALRGTTYEPIASSEVLPGIDLDSLASFLDRPKSSQAIREYRDALEQAFGVVHRRVVNTLQTRHDRASSPARARETGSVSDLHARPGDRMDRTRKTKRSAACS